MRIRTLTGAHGVVGVLGAMSLLRAGPMRSREDKKNIECRACVTVYISGFYGYRHIASMTTFSLTSSSISKPSCVT